MQPGSACLCRRCFMVPRQQGIMATSGSTQAVFPWGSSINVAAQLTLLTNSAPALHDSYPAIGSVAAGCTALRMCASKGNMPKSFTQGITHSHAFMYITVLYYYNLH